MGVLENKDKGCQAVWPWPHVLCLYNMVTKFMVTFTAFKPHGHGVAPVWSYDASETHALHAHVDHMDRSSFLSRGHTFMFADARYTTSCELCQMVWSIMVYKYTVLVRNP